MHVFEACLRYGTWHASLLFVFASHVSENSPAHHYSPSLNWASLLLRFFHLFTGNQNLAETLTIETLAEHMRESGVIHGSKPATLLLRRAVGKALGAEDRATQSDDPLLRSIVALSKQERVIVVLFSGLSLDVVRVAEVTGLSVEEVRRRCVKGLTIFAEEMRRNQNPFVER